MTAALEQRIEEHDAWIESGESSEHPYRTECAADGCLECREHEDEMDAQDREYRRMTA